MPFAMKDMGLESMILREIQTLPIQSAEPQNPTPTPTFTLTLALNLSLWRCLHTDGKEALNFAHTLTVTLAIFLA